MQRRVALDCFPAGLWGMLPLLLPWGDPGAAQAGRPGLQLVTVMSVMQDWQVNFTRYTKQVHACFAHWCGGTYL